MLAVPAIRRPIEDRTPQQLESNAEHHLNNNNDAQPTTWAEYHNRRSEFEAFRLEDEQMRRDASAGL
jgi:hypothetical protein